MRLEGKNEQLLNIVHVGTQHPRFPQRTLEALGEKVLMAVACPNSSDLRVMLLVLLESP